MLFGKRIWCEDDATLFMGPDDHEGERQAWQRLFGETLDLRKAVEKEDDGYEPVFYRMPNGIIICQTASGSEFFEPPRETP